MQDDDEIKMSPDGWECVAMLQIAMQQIKREAAAKVAKPNQWVLDLEEALKGFDENDEAALVMARDILKCEEFAGRGYFSLARLAELLDEIPPGTSQVALNPPNGELLVRLEKCVAVTVEPSYKGFPLRLRVPHPRVIVISKAQPEDTALSSTMKRRK